MALDLGFDVCKQNFGHLGAVATQAGASNNDRRRHLARRRRHGFDFAALDVPPRVRSTYNRPRVCRCHGIAILARRWFALIVIFVMERAARANIEAFAFVAHLVCRARNTVRFGRAIAARARAMARLAHLLCASFGLLRKLQLCHIEICLALCFELLQHTAVANHVRDTARHFLVEHVVAHDADLDFKTNACAKLLHRYDACLGTGRCVFQSVVGKLDGIERFLDQGLHRRFQPALLCVVEASFEKAREADGTGGTHLSVFAVSLRITDRRAFPVLHSTAPRALRACIDRRSRACAARAVAHDRADVV